MSEPEKWTSGDVVVERHREDRHWWVTPPTEGCFLVPKSAFPDPQALAEFIDSQQPKPRWRRDGAYVVSRDESISIRVLHLDVPDLDAGQVAERIARLLNDDEAAEAAFDAALSEGEG